MINIQEIKNIETSSQQKYVGPSWSVVSDEMPSVRQETQWIPVSPTPNPSVSVRLICFKGTDRDTRKLVYDSDTVRPPMPPEINYQYLPKKDDVKSLWSQMIGENGAFIKNSTNRTKIHPFSDGVTQMWSHVFHVIGPQQRSASSSINSSFGSTISISSCGESSSLRDHLRIWDEESSISSGPSSFKQDSGVFSLASAGTNSNQFQSQSFYGFDPDLASKMSLLQLGSPEPNSRLPMRGESSSSHSNGLTIKVTPESGAGLNMMAPKPSSPSHLNLPPDVPPSSRREQPTLAVGLIITTPFLSSLRTDSLFMEDVLNKAKLMTNEAYVAHSRKEFPRLMHAAWVAARDQVEAFLTVPRLRVGAYHEMVSSSSMPAAAGRWLESAKLAVKQFDTKDNGFFLSTLLSAFLRHHLGWVLSVAPSVNSEPSEVGQLEITPECQRVPSVGLYQKHQIHLEGLQGSWLQSQHAQLHGMVGQPIESCKTILVGSDEQHLKRLVYFLSFFLRSALTIDNPMKMDLSSAEQFFAELETAATASSSESVSPVPSLHAAPAGGGLLRKSCRLGDMSLPSFSPLLPHSLQNKDFVQFEIGDHERLIHPDNAVAEDPDDDEAISVKEERREEEQEKSMFTFEDIPLPFLMVEETDPDPVTARFICVSQNIPVLGAVLQGVVVPKSSPENKKMVLESFAQDLPSENESHYSKELGVLDRFCIVADVDEGNVLVYNSNEIKQQPMSGKPFPMAAIVSDLVDRIRAVQDFDPPNLALAAVDDALKDILLASKLLAEYFMNVDGANARKIKDDIGYDLYDLNLLLPVASTHTPEVSARYKLSDVTQQHM